MHLRAQETERAAFVQGFLTHTAAGLVFALLQLHACHHLYHHLLVSISHHAHCCMHTLSVRGKAWVHMYTQI